MKAVAFAILIAATPAFAESAHTTIILPGATIDPMAADHCKPGDGLVLRLEAGASITGPFSLVNTRNFEQRSDGSMHADSEDDLSVPAGQTVTGPILICSRVAAKSP